MSDRLKELQRQRALVQEQLVWLDREIAAASGTTTLNVEPVPSAQSALRSRSNPVASPSDDAAVKAAAEEIMAQYQQEKQSLHSDVKRGCFLYFIIAFAVVGLGVLALYFFRTKT